MSDTATLFDPRSDESIDARFVEFDAAHPEVYDLFKRFALELLGRGRERYSADAILHRIRWHYAVNPGKEFDGFKINDHFSSRYARKLAAEDVRFAEFFEFRVLRS
jgi:hypothetical protein